MALSQDGKRLAYVTQGQRSMDSLWVIGTAPGSVPHALGLGKMPEWAPQGHRFAYYYAAAGSLQLRVYDESTGSRVVTQLRGGIRPTAALSGYVDEPLIFSWSPDGTRIAFTSEVSLEVWRGSSSQIDAPNHLLPRRDRRSAAAPVPTGAPVVLGRNAPLSAAMQGVLAATVGNRFQNGQFTGLAAESASVPGRVVNQLFVVDIASGRTRQLTADTSGFFYPAWSPSGRVIAVTSPEGREIRGHLPDTTNLYLVDTASGRAMRLTTGPGQKRLPAWSSDGAKVAYLTRSQMFDMASVMVVPGTGGTPLNVTELLDRQLYSFHFAPDGHSIIADVPEGTSRPVVRVDAISGRVETVTPPGDVVSDWALSRSGAMAWVHNDPRHYQVLAFVDRLGDSARTLVDLNPQVASWELGDQRVVQWRSLEGDTLEGVLILPVGYTSGIRYPLVVDGYSGNTNSLQAGVIKANQTLAARGYAVFLPNHRGPHIYQNYQLKGKRYTDKGKGLKGIDVLVDDVLSGIDTLIAQGIVDSTRLAIFGYSNGGATVNYLITRTTRFRCAISAAPAVTDRATDFFLNWDPSYAVFWDEGYAPWERPDLYAAVSPVYHLDRVRTPLLLAVGDRDAGFLLGTLEMYRGLRWLNRDVTLLRYPGQAHVFEGPAMVDFWNRAYRFLDDHLSRN